MTRYRHVSTMKAEGFPVSAACDAAEVSTSAYYDWLDREVAGHQGTPPPWLLRQPQADRAHHAGL